MKSDAYELIRAGILSSSQSLVKKLAMARKKEVEGYLVRRHGHGTHYASDSTSTGHNEVPDSDLKVPDITVPKLHGKFDASAGAVSLEDGFMSLEVPRWQDQLTMRGLMVAFFLGFLFCIITHKLNLTVGIIPSLNISAGLLGFFFIRMWTAISSKCGFFTKPFTRQENTVIQTCVVSCYGIAFSGGFGSYLLGMDQATHDKISAAGAGDIPGNEDVKNPGLGWMTAFVFVVSFVGIFSIVILRKIMIIDYRLTYPSGTATGILINSFHTPGGVEIAKTQVTCLGKYFTLSFVFSAFKWFFSGIGDSCGFDQFPTLGLKAYHNMMYFDFSMTYIGAGIICPHIVNVSVLLGAILSWCLLWPLIASYEGIWYPAGLGSSNFKGLYGYKVFIAIAVILGDGLYNFIVILYKSGKELHAHYASHNQLPVSNAEILDPIDRDHARRSEIFMKEGIPPWVAFTGYVILASVSVIVIPHIFNPVKWYFVLICYIFAPILAFCNAYGCGLTDWSLASTYGKLALFIFGAWAGTNGGVLVGLAVCGVMMSIVSTASDLIQDFKTGYLTLSSPRSMFVSQLIGCAMGCVLAPLTFWLFWTAFPIGDPDGLYKAPYAIVYRSMALIGVEGFSALPGHCLEICYVMFAAAVVINILRDTLPKRISKWIPIPMAMAIPFYIGGYFAIDMFVGSIIRFVYEKIDKPKSDIMTPAIAAGLICGDGVWTIPSAILALSKINPPLCMYFYKATDPLAAVAY
nr:probable metal-nicotianamine transporter YSL6 [Physcomitrium patens]|eukprot:XP_024380047.1 probable metal-nicotianamine transporter YSL6 [Physcomitrella patens]